MGYERTLKTKDYLELIDGKLGFPKGTLYDMCIAAIKSTTEKHSGVTVTFRGIITRKKRLVHQRYLNVKKAIFLIEYIINQNGINKDRVVQVQLDL